eukprot:scaffold503985_cov44-Prasinocladus_malaysianus.AAC.1
MQTTFFQPIYTTVNDMYGAECAIEVPAALSTALKLQSYWAVQEVQFTPGFKRCNSHTPQC